MLGTSEATLWGRRTGSYRKERTTPPTVYFVDRLPLPYGPLRRTCNQWRAKAVFDWLPSSVMTVATR